MSWQPMETAPKDGSVFLAFDKFGQIFSVTWNPKVIYGSGEPGLYVKAYHSEAKPTAFVMWMTSPDLPQHLKECIEFAKAYN